jgi:hypothetical protein
MATTTPTAGMAHLTVVPENCGETTGDDGGERGEAAADRSDGDTAE